MSNIERIGFDTRIHHGVRDDTVYLTGQVGTLLPARPAGAAWPSPGHSSN